MNDLVTLNARVMCIAELRTRFRECSAHPLRKSLQERNGLKAAQVIAAIPVEAAASGFHVEVNLTNDVWSISCKSRIDSLTDFTAYGQASSLKAALVQMVESGLRCLDQHDSETRRQIRAAEREEMAAA